MISFSRNTNNVFFPLHQFFARVFGMTFISPLSIVSAKDMSTMFDLPNQANYASYSPDASSPTGTRNNKNINKFLKRNIFFIAGIAVIIIIVGLIISTVRSNTSQNVLSSTTTTTHNTSSSNKTQQINKLILFPLKDASGKELSKIKYYIQSAELDNTIVVKGQAAKAAPGREFLIISLKITNDYDKTININSRDYIRLVVDNSPEKLAADIHNDPVEVQAISTKYTRLGFPIYTSDKNLELLVGEINGPKDTIKLTLQ